MSFTPSTYNPNEKSRVIFEAAEKVINDSEVKLTVRGVFYRLLADPAVPVFEKEDYGSFLKGMAKARKRGFGSLRPWSLIDETRPLMQAGTGPRATTMEVELHIAADLLGIHPDANHWMSQPNFVEIWTESRGAVAQIAAWAPGITVRGLGGDGSIPDNWGAAERLQKAGDDYGKPLVVATIGDYDEKGVQIPVSALNTVREWCDHEIHHVQIGLTHEQVEKYKLPGKVKGYGWEWEALSTPDAKDVLLGALSRLVDLNVAVEAQREARRLAFNFGRRLLKREGYNLGGEPIFQEGDDK